MKKLTQKRLKELLHYDPETGIFIRLKNAGSRSSRGDIAGGPGGCGYRTIGIDGKRYLASRLAWLYQEGYFPENQVDHKNRIRHDDRWENLRHVTQVCNSRNSKTRTTNTSGITGVSWDQRYQKWAAYIMILGKKYHLGYFVKWNL